MNFVEVDRLRVVDREEACRRQVLKRSHSTMLWSADDIFRHNPVHPNIRDQMRQTIIGNWELRCEKGSGHELFPSDEQFWVFPELPSLERQEVNINNTGNYKNNHESQPPLNCIQYCKLNRMFYLEWNGLGYCSNYVNSLLCIWRGPKDGIAAFGIL